MQIKKWMFLFALVALMAFAVTACAETTPPTAAPTAAPKPTAVPPTAVPPTAAPPAGKGTIKIATQSPLSGGQAALGEAIKLGTQLAVKQKGKALTDLGYKLEVVPFDDQAKPDVGVANAKNLVTDPDILAVVGHLNSGVAIPSSEVYKDFDLAMVSPANTNPKVTDRGYANVNRVCGRDDVQGPVGAEFAIKNLKAKTIYVLHDKTAYGQGVAEFFRDKAKAMGATVVAFEGTEEKANFDPIITPIKAANPDVVYFGGIYDQIGPFTKQLRAKGVKSIMLGADGLDSSEFAKLAGDDAVGTYYTTTGLPASAFPDAKQFADDFKKEFGKAPEPYSAQAYDATSIIIQALASIGKDAKPNRKAVVAAVRATKGYKGLTGTFTFNKIGDPTVAKYAIIKVVSADPAKWGDNPIDSIIDLAPPEPK